MASPFNTQYQKLVGFFGFGAVDGGIGNPWQQVHDGDTIYVRTVGNIGLRFLGVDTAEISFAPPGAAFPQEIDSKAWREFLSEPFAAKYALPELDAALKAHLLTKLGAGCAENHAHHAAAARDYLRAEVQGDMLAQHRDKDTFVFFVQFAREALDVYGRLLGYVNRRDSSKDRPLTYNERMLKAGVALPYFIWPNVNPFRKQPSIVDAVPAPDKVVQLANKEQALRDARAGVREARAAARGVFAAADPLRLAPFELRFLANRAPPKRWVIDLAQATGQLKHPQRYFEIAQPEDRLYVPEEYVELFVRAGWKKQVV